MELKNISLYGLALIVVLAIIIIFLYLKINRVEKEISIMKKKYENIKHLESKNSKNTENKKDNTSSDSSLSISSSVKKTENKGKNKVLSDSKQNTKEISKENSKGISNGISKNIPNKYNEEVNIFKSLGIPNIFELFNSTKFDNLQGVEKITSHPIFESLDSSDTDDMTSSTISIIKEGNISINPTIPNNQSVQQSVQESVRQTVEKKTVEQNVKNIEDGNNTEISVIINNPINELNSVNIQNINTEDINVVRDKMDNLDKSILIEDDDKTEIDNNENIETYSNSENKNEKNNLEKLKLVELKELAKKKNINVMNGKKPKNKTELINDILKS